MQLKSRTVDRPSSTQAIQATQTILGVFNLRNNRYCQNRDYYGTNGGEIGDGGGHLT